MKGSATDTIDMFRALADEIRLRLLRAALDTELSVAELVAVLRMPQSTVSRHLKPLRDSGLLECRREGTSAYYRPGPALQDAALSGLLRAKLAEVPHAEPDASAVRRALALRRKRSREFFDRVAGRYGTLTQPGGGWDALAAGLAAGFAGQDVADLGAGEGDLTLLLARFAARVTAIDQSPAMLRHIRQRARAEGLTARVRAVAGELEGLPMEASSVDAAFLSQVLHHAPQPARAIAEAARILRPTGRLIVLDLVRHEQEWVRQQWADQWLGFEPAEVRQWMEQAGLRPLHAGRIAGAHQELGVLLAVGVRMPGAAAESTGTTRKKGNGR